MTTSGSRSAWTCAARSSKGAGVNNHAKQRDSRSQQSPPSVNRRWRTGASNDTLGCWSGCGAAATYVVGVSWSVGLGRGVCAASMRRSIEGSCWEQVSGDILVHIEWAVHRGVCVWGGPGEGGGGGGGRPCGGDGRERLGPVIATARCQRAKSQRKPRNSHCGNAAKGRERTKLLHTHLRQGMTRSEFPSRWSCEVSWGLAAD